MFDLTASSELVLRFSAFAIVLIVMAALEYAIPKRILTVPKAQRWLTNLVIVGIDSVAVRVMARIPDILGTAAVPLIAVAAAMAADAWGIGLFNWLDLPWWIAVPIAIIVLDFAIWLQHLASHKIPLLWRLHQVHHADRDIDVTTALRFHPVEIVLSMLYKVVWVVALGAPAVAVVLFEIILNACAMFNHANIDLPKRLDRIVRQVLVTPDMHRVHHSVIRREHDSNFGFNLSIWDRMFKTYTDQPEAGHLDMEIGLKRYQTDEPSSLAWSLTIPFRNRT